MSHEGGPGRVARFSSFQGMSACVVVPAPGKNGPIYPQRS